MVRWLKIIKKEFFKWLREKRREDASLNPKSVAAVGNPLTG
jgi:hypothetical protein